jgi:hypothetical protein
MWSIREDFVAVFVGQAPMVYPILKRRFWTDSLPSSAPSKSAEASYEMGKFNNSTKVSKVSKKSKDPYSISRIVGGTTVDRTMMDATRSESQERIVEEDEMAFAARQGRERRGSKGVIEVKQTFDVQSMDGRLKPGHLPWDSPSLKR